MSTDEEQFEVEEVVNHRRNPRDKQIEVMVQWKGYPKFVDNTWEPIYSLLENAGADVPIIIKKYLSSKNFTYYKKQNGSYDLRKTPNKETQSPSTSKKKVKSTQKSQPPYQSNFSNSVTLTETQSEQTAERSPPPQKGFCNIQLPVTKDKKVQKKQMPSINEMFSNASTATTQNKRQQKIQDKFQSSQTQNDKKPPPSGSPVVQPSNLTFNPALIPGLILNPNTKIQQPKPITSSVKAISEINRTNTFNEIISSSPPIAAKISSNLSEKTACFGGNTNHSSKRSRVVDDSQAIKENVMNQNQNKSQKQVDIHLNEQLIQQNRITSSEHSLQFLNEIIPKAQNRINKPKIDNNLAKNSPSQNTRQNQQNLQLQKQPSQLLNQKQQQVREKSPIDAPMMQKQENLAQSLIEQQKNLFRTKSENFKQRPVWQDETNIKVIEQKIQKSVSNDRKIQQQKSNMGKQNQPVVSQNAETPLQMDLKNIKRQGNYNPKVLMELEHDMQNIADFDNQNIQFAKAFEIPKQTDTGTQMDKPTFNSVQTLTDPSTNQKNFEVQCEIYNDSEDDNEKLEEIHVEETDSDWKIFNDITQQKLPEGCQVEQGVIWNPDHKPKKILCQAFHNDPDKYDNIEQNWGQPTQMYSNDEPGMMYCLVAFKNSNQENKVISPSWVPRCMILGNYSHLYFEYTDRILREQTDKIMNYKSKEEKKSIKLKNQQEKINPTVWNNGNKISFKEYHITVQDKILIELVCKDITDEQVCAIVNATTSDLGVHSQQSAAVRKGGYIVQHECEEHNRKFGKVDQGNCVITGAGNKLLKCKYILHAVPPQWSHSSENISVLYLKDFLTQILNVASKKGNISSLSLPAIALQYFPQSRNIYAKTMIQTMVEWSTSNIDKTQIANIRLCNSDEITHHYLKQSFDELFKQ